MKMLEKLKTSTFSWKKLYQREETVDTKSAMRLDNQDGQEF